MRKRIIPNEIVELTEDELLFMDEDLIVTKWNAIRPRKDLKWGISYTFLKDGFKVSRFYNHQDEWMFYYVDILTIDYEKKANRYVMLDLLIDVKIDPKNQLKILDLDEFATALEKGTISNVEASMALQTLHKILALHEAKQFPPKICETTSW